MKLRIKDTEYDWNDALAKADLRDLLELSKATGIGERSIRTVLSELFNATTADLAGEIGERPSTIQAMQGLVFLCLRYAGAAVKFDDITVSYADLEWVLEPRDLEDPTKASGDQTPQSEENVTAPKSHARKTSSSTSRTSRSRSTATS